MTTGMRCTARRAHSDPRAYRNALGQYATGVTVITARGADGRRVGITASSFTSVSLHPRLVSWCLSKTATHLAELEIATHFAVNVLAADQHDLSRQFAAPTQNVTTHDKFADVDLTEGIAGLPLIDGAVARFQCRTVSRIEAGDHVIFLGEVEHYDAHGGDPLLYHRGHYRTAATHPDL
ncbi:MAG TPA: flavin reductase family protein [Kribbella sp.]